ncbi:extracellular calcium-sensing receptor-like [Protopterus annectens]|uniref:extracellular calcium-sensing receptor-like n=1 Tax=Protopterus annectens TaxID=7888 RepID=UPI001CFBA2B5|nr:extracellular calcium-sensing receptor-like [Protopterus annectens]
MDTNELSPVFANEFDSVPFPCGQRGEGNSENLLQLILNLTNKVSELQEAVVRLQNPPLPVSGSENLLVQRETIDASQGVSNRHNLSQRNLDTTDGTRTTSNGNFNRVSYGSAIEALSDKYQFPSFLRTMPNDKFQYTVLVRLVTHFDWNWVGIIASDNEYGILGSQNVKKVLAVSGVCTAFTEIISLSNPQKGIRPVLEVIRKFSVTVIIAYATMNELIPFMEEIYRQNVTGKVWLATVGWMFTPIFLMKELWKSLNGTLGLAVHKGVIPGLSEFLLSLHPSTSPDDIFIRPFWEKAFACYWPKEVDRNQTQAVCTGTEQLDKNHLIKFNMLDFRYTYNVYKAVNTLAYGLHEFLSCKISSGPFANKTCSGIDNLKPWQILHYVKNVYFKDSSGETVYFDKNGDSPAVYDILNFQVSSDNRMTKYVQVGYYDSRLPAGYDLFINNSMILWNGYSTEIPHSVCSESCPPGFRKAVRRGEQVCCFDCIPCPKGEISNETDSINCFSCPEDQWSNEKQDGCIQKSIDFLSYESELGESLSSSTVLSSVITISVLCTFIKYRSTPIVKANNRELSYLILISLFFCFLCPLMFIGKPNTLTCLLRQTGFGIIFSFSVSGILAKTVTVVIAFKATKPDSKLRKYAGPKTPYFVVFFGTLVQVIICIIWLPTYPPFVDLNMNVEDGKIVVECNEGSVIMFYCMLGYLGLLASISFVVAFLVRTLPDSFNEAKFISFSMTVFLSVWLSFIPAYLSTKGKYTVAVEIFAIIASSSGIIICIFCPKCYIIVFKPYRNTRQHITGNAKSSMKM